MKELKPYQKRVLSELHFRVEELRPDYIAACEFRKHEFVSSIYDENNILILGVTVEGFQIEVRDGVARLEKYQQKLANLVDQLAQEAA